MADVANGSAGLFQRENLPPLVLTSLLSGADPFRGQAQCVVASLSVGTHVVISR